MSFARRARDILADIWWGPWGTVLLILAIVGGIGFGAYKLVMIDYNHSINKFTDTCTREHGQVQDLDQDWGEGTVKVCIRDGVVLREFRYD